LWWKKIEPELVSFWDELAIYKKNPSLFFDKTTKRSKKEQKSAPTSGIGEGDCIF